MSLVIQGRLFRELVSLDGIDAMSSPMLSWNLVQFSSTVYCSWYARNLSPKVVVFFFMVSQSALFQMGNYRCVFLLIWALTAVSTIMTPSWSEMPRVVSMFWLVQVYSCRIGLGWRLHMWWISAVGAGQLHRGCSEDVYTNFSLYTVVPLLTCPSRYPWY